MKRLVSLLLAASMTLALVACGGTGSTTQSGSAASSGAASSAGTQNPEELTPTQKIIQEAQGMTLEELDIMLQYAGMDTLGMRDQLECVLVHVLQTLSLTHPELALGNATALLAVSKNAATRRRCEALAEEYWRACYRCEDEDVESVVWYVRQVLLQLELEDAEELISLLE